ncbi:MAG TPA: pyridoxal-phosphate dependent enzyme [Acidimicrobiia bacterium]|nr:pyridoxal-phosphate dependent enzyme [Acidimicrobiia bacterium]
MDIHPDVLSAVGGTPLVRLSRLQPAGNLLGKIEFVNPGGSVKDRIAASMIDRAEAAGLMRPGGTIVEPTSGNTGAALAMLAAVRGYHLVAVMTDKVSKEKQDLLQAYGAEVVICPSDVAPDDPRSYYSTGARIAAERGAFRPDQYANPANPEGHYATTGPEIWRQTDGQVGVLVAGVGTGGTITGTARYLKERNPGVWVVGADPEGSVFTARSPEEVHSYLTEGVGEDFWPEAFDPGLVDEYEMVGDGEAFRTARRLAAAEGILAGGSSGMAVAAALRVATRRPGDLVVVILPDSGRNYLSKVFDDGWMREHGFLEES